MFKDADIMLLQLIQELGCTDEEGAAIARFHNDNLERKVSVDMRNLRKKVTAYAEGKCRSGRSEVEFNVPDDLSLEVDVVKVSGLVHLS